MKLVYGISRWTNPSRPGARHIDNGEGKPLCGGQGRKVLSWELEEGMPSCSACKSLQLTKSCRWRMKNHLVTDEEFNAILEAKV